MAETVLLVGGGGREHALARALVGTDRETTLFACASNRNPGIADLAEEVRTLDETHPTAVVAYATEVEASLAVIGPEAPLAGGVADALDKAGIYTFAPHKSEARIETDKAFQRRFMDRHSIAGCPDFATFDDMEMACEYIESYDGDLAVKPAGLTGGKGVRVTGDQITKEEATTYLRESEYDRVVLEERLVGEEFTVQAFVANGEFRASPAVQDHKRAYEDDEGPNTGGMGSYSDTSPHLPFMTEAEYEESVSILDSVVRALDGYKGILYGQFMLTADGVKVVEFNARFGDPEAMNTLPVLETPFCDVLVAAREGDPLPELEFTPQATVCKYAVPAGYPTDPVGGTKIAFDAAILGEAELFYASVDERDDGIYTTTSRSFAVVGRADTISEAEGIAEEAMGEILQEAETDADGDETLHVRHDIGTPELVQRRIDHMDEIRG